MAKFDYRIFQTIYIFPFILIYYVSDTSERSENANTSNTTFNLREGMQKTSTQNKHDVIKIQN
jgi:hypothetical protein